ALTTIFDYDSRAYLALAREKEAKRRARFEAVKQRLMEDDMELALAGSRLSASIMRIMLNFFLMFFQGTSVGNFFKNNTPLGNIGAIFIVSWLSYHGYHWAKVRYQAYCNQQKELQKQVGNCQN